VESCVARFAATGIADETVAVHNPAKNLRGRARTVARASVKHIGMVGWEECLLFVVKTKESVG